MSNLTSTLTISLIDGVSKVAGKISNSLKQVDHAAKGVKGGAMAAGRSAGGGVGVGGAAVFGGLGGTMVGALGAYAGAAAAKKAYTDFAADDRRFTRILVTANAAAREADSTRKAVQAISNDLALPTSDVVTGLESLVAAGRELPDALAFLPSVASTAQAAGAEVEDIAKTADSIGASFGVASVNMQKAFDILAHSGKEGKFELKDQARYLPSILPLAATRGVNGLEGLSKMSAALQVIRKNSGTSEEAATALVDVLGKLDSDETIKKFSKNFGINLPKALQKAKKEGKDTFSAFLDIVNLAVNGDLEKLNMIFADKEARRGITALTQYRDEYAKLIAAGRNSAGTVAADLPRVTNDAQASIERLSNSWGNAMIAMGRAADNAGITKVLEQIAKTANIFSTVVEAESKSPGSGRDAFTKKASEEGIDKATAEAIYEYHTGTPSTKTASEQAQQRIDAARKKAEGIQKRNSLGAKNRAAVVSRLEELKANGGSKSTIAALEERLVGMDAAIRDNEKRIADQQAIIWQAQAELGNITPSQRFAPGPVYNAPTGPVSGATRARPRSNLDPAMIKEVPPVDMGVKVDEAAAAREAAVARARVQSYLDANPPVIRPRVEMPSLNLGAAVTDGINGANSDTGGRR